MAYTMAQATGLGLPMTGASDYRSPSTPQMPSQSTPTPVSSPAQAAGGSIRNIGGALYYEDTGSGTASQAQQAMQQAAPGVNLSVGTTVSQRGGTVSQRWDASQYLTPTQRETLAPLPTAPIQLTPLKQITPTLQTTPAAFQFPQLPQVGLAYAVGQPGQTALYKETKQLTTLSEDDKRILRGSSPELDPTLKNINDSPGLVKMVLDAREARGADLTTGETTTGVAAAASALGVPKTTSENVLPLPNMKEADIIDVTFPGEKSKSMTVGEYRTELASERASFLESHPVAKVYDDGQKWVGLTGNFVDLKKTPGATVTETLPDGTVASVPATDISNDEILAKMAKGSEFKIETPATTITREDALPSFIPRYSIVNTAGTKMVWDADAKEYKAISPQGTFKMATEESDWLKGLVGNVLTTGSGVVGAVSDVTVKPVAELIGGKSIVAQNLGRMSEEVKSDIKSISTESAKIFEPSVSVKMVDDPLLQRMEAAKYKLEVGPASPISKFVGASEITLLGSKAGGPIYMKTPDGQRLATTGDLYAKREQYIEEGKKLEGPFGLAKLGVDIEGAAQRVEKTGVLGDALARGTEDYIKTNIPLITVIPEGRQLITDMSKFSKGVGDLLAGPTAFGARTGAQTVEAGYQFATGGLEQGMRWRERISQGAKAAGMQYGAEGGSVVGLTVPGIIIEKIAPGTLSGPGTGHYTGSLRKQLEGERTDATGATLQAGITGGLYSGLGALSAYAKPAEGVAATGIKKYALSLPLGISGVSSGTQLLQGAPAEKVIGAFLGPQVVSGIGTAIQTTQPGLVKLAGDVKTKIGDIVAPKVRETIKWDPFGEQPDVSTFKIDRPPKVEFKVEGGEVKRVETPQSDTRVVTSARTKGTVEKYSADTGRYLGESGKAEYLSSSDMTSRKLSPFETKLGTIGGEEITPAGVATGTTITKTTLSGRPGVKIFDTTESPLGLFYPETAPTQKPLGLFYPQGAEQKPLGLFYDTPDLRPIRVLSPGGAEKITMGTESQYISFPGTSVKTGAGIKGIETDFWRFDPATGLLQPAGTKALSLTGWQRMYSELGTAQMQLQTTGAGNVPVPEGFTGVKSLVSRLAPGQQIPEVGTYTTGEAGTVVSGAQPRSGYGLMLAEPGKPTIVAGVESSGMPILPSSIPKGSIPGIADIRYASLGGLKSIPKISWSGAPTVTTDSMVIAGPEVGQRPLGLFYPSETLPVATSTPSTISSSGIMAPVGRGEAQIQLTKTEPLSTLTTTLTQPTEFASTAAGISMMAPQTQVFMPTRAVVAPPAMSATMTAPAIQIFAPPPILSVSAERTTPGVSINSQSEMMAPLISIPRVKQIEDVLPGIQIQQQVTQPGEMVSLERTLPGITYAPPKVMEQIAIKQPQDIVPGITITQPPSEAIKIKPSEDIIIGKKDEAKPPQQPGTGFPGIPPIGGGMGGGMMPLGFGGGRSPLVRKRKTEAYASLLNVMRSQVAGYKGTSLPTYQSYTSELNLPTMEQLQGKVGKTFDFAPKVNPFRGTALTPTKMGTPKLTMGNMLKGFGVGKRR